MPTKVAADNYTPQAVADLGGPEGVWRSLFDRMWQNDLAHIRDLRQWVVRFSRPEPSPIPGDLLQRVTFAIECHYWLSDPRTAQIGDVAHPTSMPQAAVEPDNDPPRATLQGHVFRQTVHGWERLS